MCGRLRLSSLSVCPTWASSCSPLGQLAWHRGPSRTAPHGRAAPHSQPSHMSRLGLCPVALPLSSSSSSISGQRDLAAQQAALRLQQQPQHSAAQGLDQRLGLVAGSAGTVAVRPQLQATARSPAQPNIMDWRPEEYAGVKLLMDDSTMVQSFAEQVQSMPLTALMPMQAQLRWVPAYHLPPWSTSISRPSTHDPELHEHG